MNVRDYQSLLRHEGIRTNTFALDRVDGLTGWASTEWTEEQRPFTRPLWRMYVEACRGQPDHLRKSGVYSRPSCDLPDQFTTG